MWLWARRGCNQPDRLLKPTGKGRWRWMGNGNLGRKSSGGLGVDFYNAGSYEEDCSGVFSRNGSWATMIPHLGGGYRITRAQMLSLQHFLYFRKGIDAQIGQPEVFRNASIGLESLPRQSTVSIQCMTSL